MKACGWARCVCKSLASGTWLTWDRQRLARTGGTLEQYKHPCLIADLKFRESMTVEQELGPG